MLFAKRVEYEGEVIFKDRCMLCHSLTSSGESMVGSGTIVGLTKKELEESLSRYRAGITDKHGLGVVMSEMAKELSKRDIEELARYLATVK